MARKNKADDRTYNREWYKRKSESDPKWYAERREYNNNRVKANYKKRKNAVMEKHATALASMSDTKEITKYLNEHFRLIITKGGKVII